MKPAFSEISPQSSNAPFESADNVDGNQYKFFEDYFFDISGNTVSFQKTIFYLLVTDWIRNSELLIAKIQSFADQLDEEVYRRCILATKNYINSRDFIAPNKYKTTSYFYGAFQYNSESQALKNLNQKLDQLIENIPEQNISWQESFENLWSRTTSTLLSAFDFAKENPLLTITALLYGQVVLASAFPAVFELSSLDGSDGFKINGEVKDDYSGWSVSSAGDINGDGIDDLIIGAYSAGIGGASYVVFGKNETWATPLELSTLDGTNGFKINGEAADDRSGYSVSSAGDINDDGIDDLIIGAYSADPGGRNFAGSSYVVFGKTGTWTTPLELSTLNGINGFKINGEAKEDTSGWSVSSAGDINGDGIADLIIGSPGADTYDGSTHVIFGKNGTWATPLELSTLNGVNGFKIVGEADEFSSYSVSPVGDINGDGIADLIIGAPDASPGVEANAGSSYVIFGKKETWATPLELSTLNGTNGFKINGEVKYDKSGHSVSAAGDINGDGIDDLIIGAYEADPDGKSSAGSSYVIFGKNETWATPFELSTLNGTNGFKINGEATGDSSGASVSSAGDINGDGIDDLIIGADGADPGGENSAGSSYVIFGKHEAWTMPFELSTLNGTNGFKINGEVTYDYSGCSVSKAGDINGDGIDDLIIGAYGADFDAGSSYVIFGVNLPPVLIGNSSSIDYLENELAKIIDNSIIVTDTDNWNLMSGTVSIVNNFQLQEDELNFVDQNGIMGVYNSTTGVLTLTGSSTLANYQAALRNITYYNLSNNPTTTPRNISFIVNDRWHDSIPFIRTINIIAVDDLPILSSDNVASLNYTENEGAKIVDDKITIVSWDSVNLTNATIWLTNIFDFPQEGLNFTDQNGIVGSSYKEVGLLTLNGTSSVANYQTALRNITYINLSEHPTPGLRTVIFIVNDGIGNSNIFTRDINTIPINDAPVLANNGGSFNYTENDPATIVDSSITISDVDNVNLTNATIAVTNNFHYPEDVLTFMDQNGVSGFYNGATGVLALTGSSSIAHYQIALRNVTYINLSDHPTTDLRTVTFMVNDGIENSNAITRDINIISVQDVPVITLSEVSLNYTENSGAVVIVPTLTVVDLDHANLTSAIISITNNFDSEQDVLIFIDQNDIEGSYNDTTGILFLAGSSNVANYQTALRSIEYENLSEDPTTSPRTISFIVDDGVKTSEPAIRHINIIPVNNAPVLTNNGLNLNYTENDPATIVDSSITVFDADDTNLTGATVSITNNFNFMQDVLSFTNQNGITGFYNSGTGILTLTGSASAENYQAALRNVKYNNLSEQPMTADRTIAFIVSDGQINSAAITRVIHIISVHDVPVITLSGSALSYTEREPAKIIDPNLNIVDLDSVELYWATVSIANNFNFVQDVLSFIDQHGITGSYNNETGILTLTGTSNIANYQIALRDIRYENLANNPTTDPRSIAFVVNDGFVSSVPAIRNITIIPANNTPTTDDGGFDFGGKLFNTILLASIGGLIGFLFLALRICLYRKATQSFEKLTSIGDVSTTEQQKKFQTNILRPIAQAIFDRIKITGCFGFISDNRMKDYLNAVMKLIVELQRQAINMDLDNMSPVSQSLIISEIAKQTENVLLPAQGCCTCGACCRCLSKLCSAQVSPEVMEAQVFTIAIAIKNALKRNNYDTFLSRQSGGSGSNQNQSKVYEAPIEMVVLGGGLFAKSGNAPLPTPVNQVAVEKPVFGGADAKYVPMEAPLLKSFNSNQAKDKVCAIDLVQSNMSRFGNSADPSYRADSSQPKSPAFFQAPDGNKPPVMPVSKGLDEKQIKQNVFRV